MSLATATDSEGPAPGVCEPKSNSEPETTGFSDAKVRKLQCEMREYLASQLIYQYVPESSKVLFLDKRLSVSSALRAMHEYRRPFACVYDDDLYEYSFLFDSAHSRAYFLHIWSYYNDLQYVMKLRRLLKDLVKDNRNLRYELRDWYGGDVSGGGGEIDTLSDHIHADDDTGDDLFDDSTLHLLSGQAVGATAVTTTTTTSSSGDWSSRKQQLINPGTSSNSSITIADGTPDGATTTAGPPHPSVDQGACGKKVFCLSDFESERTRPPLLKYGVLLKALSESSCPSSDSDGGMMSIIEESINRSRTECTPLVREKILSIHRKIESVISAPWDYTLDRWHKFRGFVQPTFPFISMRCTLLHAMQLGLDLPSQHTVVWNEERGSPFSFLTMVSILGHLVQHLQGSCEGFEFRILKNLKLGQNGPDQVDVITDNMTLRDVICVMRALGRTCLPIVSHHDGQYIGLFSDSHFTYIVTKALFCEKESIQWDSPILYFWNKLVDAGAAHSRYEIHTFSPQFSSDEENMSSDEEDDDEDEDDDDDVHITFQEKEATSVRPPTWQQSKPSSLDQPRATVPDSGGEESVHRSQHSKPPKIDTLASPGVEIFTGMVIGDSSSNVTPAGNLSRSTQRSPPGGAFMSKISEAVAAQRMRQEVMAERINVNKDVNSSPSSLKREGNSEATTKAGGGTAGEKRSRKYRKAPSGNRTPTLMQTKLLDGSSPVPGGNSELYSQNRICTDPNVPKTSGQPGLSGTAAAVQSLVSSIACSAAIGDRDMSLGNAILHVVLTDDRCIVFVDPKTLLIKAVVTPEDLCRLLIGHVSPDTLDRLPQRSALGYYHLVSPPSEMKVGEKIDEAGGVHLPTPQHEASL